MSQAGALRFTGGGGGGTILTLTGNSGGPVGPDGFGDINVIGDGTTINVAGNPGTNTLTISTLGDVAIDFTADDGLTATPVGGNLNIFGGPNINTEAPGSADTIQVNLNESILLPATTGANTGVIGLGVSLTGDRFIHNYGAGGVTDENTFIGRSSGNFTLQATAQGNTGTGGGTLENLTTGGDNTAIGFQALNAVDIGNFNIGLGSAALLNLTSGDDNVALGYQTLANLTTGGDNLAVGTQAGSNYTGNESNNLLISNFGVIGDASTIRIGTQGVGFGEQNQAYMAGIYQTTPGATYEVGFVGSDGKLGTVTGNDFEVLKGNTGANPEWASVTSTDGSVIITEGTNFLNLEVIGTPAEFTVTTNNAVATPIATFTLTNDSAWTILVDVVAAKDDFTASYWGSATFGVRKDGATPSVVVGVTPVNQGNDSTTGVPILNVAATGGPDIDINVTGIAAEIWNWKAIISTIKLP